MSTGTPKDRPGLLAYLDKRMGGHSGSWPEYQWFCAFCLDRRGSESNERKFRMNISKGRGMCFRCGYGCHSLEGLFKSLNGGGLTVDEQGLIDGEVRVSEMSSIRDELLVRFYATERIPAIRPVPLPPEYIPLKGNGNLAKVRPAFVYLRQVRHFTTGLAQFIERHRVGYCAFGDYAHRLIFPVMQGGKQVYFTSRYCGDHLLKGKNPKNQPNRFTKETCLLNYDGCAGAKRVFVVEGPLSMAAFEHPCALMGKALSDGQLHLLETLAEQGTEEFVLATDPDASREAAEVLRRMKGGLPRVSYLRLAGGDPFDLRESIGPFVDERRETVGLADALRGMKFQMPRRSVVRT